MKKLLYILFLGIFHFALAQSKNEPPPPISLENDKQLVIKEKQKTYFDFYGDFENYIAGQESKYKNIYDKYVIKDSIPNYIKMTRKANEYPAPCYKILGDNTVQSSTVYTHFFILQTLMNGYTCNKDGNSYISRKNYWNDNKGGKFNNEITRQAIEYLIENEKKNFSKKELDLFFEEAKKFFRAGSFQQANVLFAFLATVDEHYREASLNNVGLTFYNQKEYDYALIYFKKAIELYPKGYLGYLNAGACLANIPVDLGDENQSGSYFRKAYELAPNNPNAIFNYANALSQCTTQGVDIQDLKENLFAQAVQSKQNEPLFKFQYAKQLHLKAQEEVYSEELFTNGLNAYNDAIEKFPDYADNYLYKAKLLRAWSRNKQYPENRILIDSVCSLLEKYKSLQEESYDTKNDRICTVYPKIKNNTVRNHTELLNGWEEISLAKGDLNKDDFEDIVLITRAVNASKINQVIRYNTPNHEKGMKNYNYYSLYVLFYNSIQNNYEIKEVNDNILSINEGGYYDEEYEVQIKNGAFRLINKANPTSGSLTRIFRWEDDRFMCIGTNQNLYIDKLGNVSSSGFDDIKQSIKEYNLSYNYNTKTLELSKLNTVTNKKETTTYTIELEKYEIKNAEKNEWKIFSKVEEIIKNYR
ncbi:tetratricopeptide repeat protein [Epilithonimonas tenax]|uniref:tetratricopeptide repeat protein n=1 Tax=Epilithonimonas tenax TaxID=191577 RepID=UPI0003FF776D|nr:tetratricopeptide repeat protein [Epilithonimonas tenax]